MYDMIQTNMPLHVTLYYHSDTVCSGEKKEQAHLHRDQDRWGNMIEMHIM